MNVIFHTLFGSHIYGTNTSESDKDYKAIFIASLDDIVLGRAKHTIQQNSKSNKVHGERNTKDDTDCEYIELRKFLHDAQAGQTYALDMIFVPKSFWLSSSPTWEQIVANRDKLLSRNVAPYIGYCRQQAGKYGLKGARLAELKKVISHLSTHKPKERLRTALNGLELSDFLRIEKAVLKNSPIEQEFLEVLGKKFMMNLHIDEVLRSLRMAELGYGERSAQAMKNEGVDWKAISHAFRCCYQLQELALTHHIEFPLKSREFLKQVKAGEIPYSELGDDLYEQMEVAKDMVAMSTLPDEPDRPMWEEFIINTYLS